MSVSGDHGTGSVIVNFMNISGRICVDGWDDVDARVVCKNLGYADGNVINISMFLFRYTCSDLYSLITFSTP